MSDVAKLRAIVDADDRPLDQALARATRKYEAFGARAEQIGGRMSMAFTAPIVGAIGLGVKQLVSFDEAMRNVNSIGGQTEDQFRATTDAVMGLSTDFGKAAGDLARGLYDINSSGFQGAEGVKVLDSATRSARAGVAQVSESAKGLTAVLNAYGLGAGEAARISDVMFQTVKDGVITFPELANEIGDVISTASAVKIPFEEIGGAIATMTVKGVKASESMTALNQVIVQLISPSEIARKAAAELGLGWLAAGKGAEHLEKVGLQKTMEEIAEATGGSAEEISKLFPEIRSLKGAFILSADGAKTFAKFVDNAKNSAGASTAALKEQQKSLAFQFDRAWAQINATLITGVKLFTPEMEGISETVRHTAADFEALPVGVRKGIIGLTLFVAAAGPATYAAGALVSAIKTLGLVSATTKGLDLLSGRAYIAGNLIKLLSVAMRVDGVAGARALIAANGGVTASLLGSSTAAGGFARVLGVLANPITLAVAALGGLTYALWKSNEGWKGNIQSANAARLAIAQARAELAGMSRDELVREKRLQAKSLAGVDAKKKKLMEVLDASEQANQFPLNESAGLYDIGAGMEMGKLNKQATDLQNKLKAVNQELSSIDKQSAASAKADAQRMSDLLKQKADLGRLLAGGSGSGAEKVSATKEMTAAQTAASLATDSLNQKIRDYRREMALANDTSQEAAIRYDILTGAYAGVDDSIVQYGLSLAMQSDEQKLAAAMTAAQTEEMNASALAAEQLAGIQSGALLDSLKSLAEISGDRRMRSFLDNFSAYLPKDLSTIPTLGALREYIKTLPMEVQTAFEVVDKAIAGTGSRSAAAALRDRIREALGGARAEYVQLLAEMSGDKGLQAWVDSFATPSALEGITTVDELRAAFLKATPAIQAASREIGDWESKTDAAADATKRQTAAMESLDRMLADQGVELSKLTGRWTTQDELMRALNITASDLSEDGMKKLTQAAANASAIDAATGVRQFLDDTKSMFADAFESLYTDGFGGFFDNVLMGLDKLLQQMAAKIMATQVTNWLVNLAGGSGGWLGKAIGGKASGGPVMAGTPYVVGERGPELFVPRQPGSIVPSGRLAMAGGPPMVVHQSFTIVTPNPEAFRRSESQILERAGRGIEAVRRRNGG